MAKAASAFHSSRANVIAWVGRFDRVSVSQNADRAQLLYVIKEKWNCGFIRPDRSDKTIKFEVRNLGELVSTVIPHFRANPLMSSKQNDFDKFARVCEWMSGAKHLEIEGVEK